MNDDWLVPVPYDRKAAVKRIAAGLPELRVGDEWTFNAEHAPNVHIVALEELKDVPWPMVFYCYGPSDVRWNSGAPMFKYGKLVRRGEGPAWRPGMEMAE